jgi:hypothetical protein
MKQVFSTLSSGQCYVQWVGGEMRRSVVIQGTDKSNFSTGSVSWSVPVPVAPAITEVSEEDATFLVAHEQFLEHQERGFVKIAEHPRSERSAASSNYGASHV